MMQNTNMIAIRHALLFFVTNLNHFIMLMSFLSVSQGCIMGETSDLVSTVELIS